MLPHIEIVLPIYNEEKNILPLLELLDAAKSSLRGQATVSFLFINDGSSDHSQKILHRLFNERGDIRVVDFIHNFGHSSALAAGLKYFRGDIAVFMDADLQDSPAALQEMLQAWKRGARTVVAERGSRKERHQFFIRTFYYLLHKSSRRLPPIAFGTFCLLDRTVVERMRQLSETTRYFPDLVAFASKQITAIRIDRESRAHGRSRVGALGLINLALTALLSSSSSPVKLVSVLGLLCSGAAFVGTCIFLSLKLFTPLAIPGWASTMTLMAFASGIQLLCLGIIGEYVARIYDEVKQRPLFLVDSILEKDSLSSSLEPNRLSA